MPAHEAASPNPFALDPGPDGAGRIAKFRELVVRPESTLFAGAGGAGTDRAIAAFLNTVGRDIDAMRKVERRLIAELTPYRAVFRDSFPDFEYRRPVYLYPSLYNRDAGLFTVDGKLTLVRCFGRRFAARSSSSPRLPNVRHVGILSRPAPPPDRH